MLERFPIDKRSSFEQTCEIKMWHYHPQSLLIKMITCYIIFKCYTPNIISIGRLIKYAYGTIYLYFLLLRARVYLNSASQTRKYFFVDQMNSLPGVKLRWKTVSDGWISQKERIYLLDNFYERIKQWTWLTPHDVGRWWKKLFSLRSILLTFARCQFFIWLLLFKVHFLFFMLILLIIRNCWDWLTARKQLFTTVKQFMNAFQYCFITSLCLWTKLQTGRTVYSRPQAAVQL